MKRKLLLLLSFGIALSILAAGISFAEGQQEQAGWQPEKSIRLIVPWGAGGATDQTNRTLASEMEDILGTKIAVVNQPGASGATGTKNAWNQPHDGYTWLGNAAANVGTYQVMELADISHKKWQGHFAIFTPCIIAVNPDSDIKNWDDLMNAFRNRKVKVASAGTASGGHIALTTFVNNMENVKYNHVPYKGGHPAVVSTVSGETEVVMQLSMEEADMLRAGKLRAIAVFDDKPLKISDYGEIPPITKFVSDMPSVGFNFGFFIPEDVPDVRKKAIRDAFIKAAKSDAIKKMAQERGSKQVVIYGDEADQVVDNIASSMGWILYNSDVADVSPAEFDIPKP
jgi:tripartite-type tricarboxylate transporter receptor subunit TctC